jgi:mRNA interferase HigB
MRIISYGRIRDFYELHPESQVSLDAWYDITADADWKNFAEIRATFRTADLYGRCTIFDVGNNKYRLVAWVSYQTHKVFIRRVMTHAEYDKDKWKSDCEKSKS